MHISLDSALGQQRRLNQVGESITQIAPDPAAAYSLRSLTGGDPKVVRVRRGSDNHEQDFTASDVSSGALVDFVNAQVVAPLDIQALSATGRDGDFLIAKAAYSLRSLGTRQATVAATGDTVARADGKFVCQVRRSSDDALKSFTATEVTDGTLLSFVNQIQTVGTAVNGTGSVNNYTLTNVSTTGFSADNSAGGTGSAGFPYVFKNGDVIVVKYTVTNFNSTSSLSPVLRGTSSRSSTAQRASGGNAFTANGTYTDTLTATADGTHLMFADANTGSYTISAFEIVSHSSNGFVKTWYDQSVTTQAGDTATGNHATQATAADQPKIVSAGALNTDGGLLFDSSEFDLGSSVSLGSAHSIFAVAKTSTARSANHPNLLTNPTNGRGVGLYADAITDKAVASSNDDNSFNFSSNTNRKLMSVTSDATNVNGFENGTASSDNTRSHSLTNNSFIEIGGGSNFAGTIEEIIVYLSDQTDNRTAIEANIGEVYSIDLPSGVDPGFDQVDGFVETWYDQSGNSNNATQLTAAEQPKIVDAGSLITGGGIAFDGSDDQLDFTALNATDLAIFSVVKFDSVSGQERILGEDSSNSEGFGIGSSTTGFFRGNGGSSNGPSLNATVSTSGDFLFSANRASNTVGFFTKGVASATATNSDAFKANSIGGSTNPIDGNLKEIIIYTSDQTANRSALETNIAAEYGITLS